VRLGHGALQVVVPALERRARLRPQRPDDRQGLLQPVGPVPAGAELQAQHGVLVLGPSGADAELQPAAAEMIDGHRHLRQDPRVAVGVADHRAADPDPGGQLGHRGQHGPGLEDRAVVALAESGEVIHDPAAVEARLVGEPPEPAQLVDGRVLGELEAESQ
jgi:hypothetical protein